MPMRQPEGFNVGGGWFKTMAEARAAAAPVLARKAKQAAARVAQAKPAVVDIELQKGSDGEGKWVVKVEFTAPPDGFAGLSKRVHGVFIMSSSCELPSVSLVLRSSAADLPDVFQRAATWLRQLCQGNKRHPESQRGL